MYNSLWVNLTIFSSVKGRRIVALNLTVCFTWFLWRVWTLKNVFITQSHTRSDISLPANNVIGFLKFLPRLLTDRNWICVSLQRDTSKFGHRLGLFMGGLEREFNSLGRFPSMKRALEEAKQLKTDEHSTAP